MTGRLSLFPFLVDASSKFSNKNFQGKKRRRGKEREKEFEVRCMMHSAFLLFTKYSSKMT